MALALTDVQKWYGDFQALSGINLRVAERAIFGLLGPNGAGKTTCIRLIMRILLPDGGAVCWRGRPVADHPRCCFGYLPEERGLYPRMRVRDQLIFLGRLRGMDLSAARTAADAWLQRVSLEGHATKRVEQLSKGNQQRVQFIAAVLHRPELVVLDEPFSGLDPMGVALLRELILEVQAQGTTLLLSSHRVDQVEDLCAEVALIARGQVVLAGNLSEIKRAEGRPAVRLGFAGDWSFLGRFPGVRRAKETARYVQLTLPPQVDPQDLLAAATAAGRVSHFELAEPSLAEIYIRRVGQSGA